MPTSTLVKIYIVDGDELMTFDNSPYSSHDIAALEQGVHDVVNRQWEYDSVFHKMIYNPWVAHVDLFMDEEDASSGTLTFRHDNGGDAIPEDWAAKYLDNTFVLNNPEEMYPLLPVWGWPWTNKVTVHFSCGPWSPTKPEPTVTITDSTKKTTTETLTVTFNTTDNSRTVSVNGKPTRKPRVVPQSSRGKWVRNSSGRLSRGWGY